ncbi:MAG: glutamate-1-semialdehyde 2,1-aminomutase [Armatimonadota bacterium]|nr:glutamate-1-semialdehyde 2,1-aminomutase [Armatimonadota bacterium]MDR7437585.1 glutamate-1-semialdehyde 2,1-aminomutase [Armatimonadota bacterium]MDR7472179.1 glutamate-1-semialdehyde 2,1-aminomutase [Armatimonadota bacterium]MDR7583255.1 glutamate-1-semialdehyde 2,1-aminomutase [Armatimonadota bacterium]
MSDASDALFARAQRLFPGGVNSPVRAFGAVGGTPRFVVRGEGAYVWDADGARLLDYIASWGAVILGHGAPEVVEAVRDAVGRGAPAGVPSPAELELAEAIQAALPSVERLRFVSSGTEAVMSAVRVARAATGRSAILKFAGCYHGHADALLVRSGSGVATLGLPGSAGVPADATRHTLVAPYNDAGAVEDLFRRSGDEIAAVVVEPVAANMGVVLPQPDFLPALRELTWRYGAVLIFDEVITGFRVAWGGAQRRYGIRPDLTCLGKIIGGGLPVGAYGGRRDLMDQVAPRGQVYQAGTLAGHPVVMAAGAAVLRRLSQPGVYELLEARAARLAAGLRQAAEGRASVAQAGGMLTVFFRSAPPADYAQAQECDTGAYAAFFHRMLERGVLPPPSQFEGWFLTLAHGDREIDATVAAAGEAV